MQLSRDQVNTILKNAPTGVDKAKLLDGLVAKGYDLEGVDNNAVRQSLAQKAQATAPTPEQKPGFLDQAGKIVDTAGSHISDVLTNQNGGRSIGNKALNATATAFNAVPQVAMAAVNQIPGAKPITDAVGNAIGSGFEWLTNKISDSKALQDWTANHPQAYKQLTDALQNNEALGQISGTILGADQVAKGAQAISDKTVQVAQDTANKVGDFANEKIAQVQDLGNKAKDMAMGAKDKAQLTIAEKNIGPQIKTSASRMDDPLGTYGKYVNQSKLSITDVKVKEPTYNVGENIGKGLKDVIKQKQAVGAKIGELLKTADKTPVDITPTFTDFETQLNDSGLRFNGKKIVGGSTAKMGTSDMGMLTDYVNELNKLGANPTIQQIDAFLARAKSLTGDFKAKNNITGMTNAERLISRTNSTLIKNFDAFPELAQARSVYADLSGFINEGAGFLGKITQNGNFAKGASVAKSAVQSILDNGKKDWLIRLEELTGYNALDDASIALQAMSDAGLAKGKSMLQLLSDGNVPNIPTSPTGLWGRVINYAAKKGTSMLAGTPEEQTRAFLQSLENSQSAPIATKAITATKAKTGLSASKIKNPSK